MRTPFDQFAKQMTSAGFRMGGTVQTDQEVSPDTGRIDVWFTPGGPEAERALSVLGMLGRIGRSPCTLEPFHRTPDGVAVMDCVCKQHHFRKLLRRRDPKSHLPTQWVISAGRPGRAILGLRFEPLRGWGPGVYAAPPLTTTRLVVVSELPETRDTLLLRLMGAGKVLARAIEELKQLQGDAFERALALPILLRLRLDIPAEPMKRTREDEEFLMSTQDIVETYLQRERQAARVEGRGEALLDLYTDRFGPPPADVAEIVARTHDQTILRAWLKLVASASAEEVLSAIRAHTPS